MADDHALWGHSAGGAFASYALLARPGAFGRFIIGSGTNGLTIDLEAEYANDHDDLDAKVFIGMADGEINHAPLCAQRSDQPHDPAGGEPAAARLSEPGPAHPALHRPRPLHRDAAHHRRRDAACVRRPDRGAGEAELVAGSRSGRRPNPSRPRQVAAAPPQWSPSRPHRILDAFRLVNPKRRIRHGLHIRPLGTHSSCGRARLRGEFGHPHVPQLAPERLPGPSPTRTASWTRCADSA